MKKIFTLAFAIVLVLSIAAPALAATVDTGVVVSSGGGTIPIVKCKWEQEPITVLESGDPSHLTLGTQIDPPMVKCAKKMIQYYAVVTDEEDMGDVYEVFAVVRHPEESPAPYDADDPYWGPNFKYKVVFTNMGHDATAINLVKAAYNAGLIKFGDDYTLSEITNGVDGEMDKGTADLWMGQELIDYEQPAGMYDVEVTAVDTNNNPSIVLCNQFKYVAIAGIEVDFEKLNYGSVNLNSTKQIAGDITWNPTVIVPDVAGDPPLTGTGNRATVRNIGNTWTHVKVQQSDMGFNFAGAGPGTAYLGSTEPTTAQSNWNVYFGARMGSTAPWLWYDPNVQVTLCEYLGLSLQDELDFAINVKNGFGDNHVGSMVLSAVYEAFSPSGTPQGFTSPCDPE